MSEDRLWMFGRKGFEWGDKQSCRMLTGNDQ